MDVGAGTVLVLEAGGAMKTIGNVTHAASSAAHLDQAIAIAAGASSKNVS